MIFSTRMNRLIYQYLTLVLVITISACQTKTTYSHTVVSADEVVQKQLVQPGEKVSIYTSDGSEYIMYLHYYDSEVFMGYVTVIGKKGANRYQYFEENDGITEHLRKVPVDTISNIGLYGQSTSTGPNNFTKDLSKTILYCLGTLGLVCQ